jgi:replicative DNA helicase
MILIPKRSDEAVKNALKEVEERKQGLKKGLLTPYSKLNKFTGGFQPGWTYMIAAGSGIGKTTFLNIIENSLYTVNKEKILLLSWNLEVSSTMTIMKKVSAELGIEIDKLLSFNEPVSDDVLAKIQKVSQKYQSQPIFYFEDSSSVKDIEDTIYFYHEECQKKLKEKGEKWKILVMLDHTLLVEKEKFQDNNGLVADIGKMSIRVKKKTDCTFIFLGQLNGNQEKIDRLQNPMFHAPIKDDLYGGKEIWHALDWVGMMVRPDLLGLDSYTVQNLPCIDRLYLHFIKARFGQLGYTVYDTSKIGVNKLIEL